ncbi:MAG: ankyrin repeat domain-containing protein, partial [Promethearchaeia archaeon]
AGEEEAGTWKVCGEGGGWSTSTEHYPTYVCACVRVLCRMGASDSKAVADCCGSRKAIDNGGGGAGVQNGGGWGLMPMVGAAGSTKANGGSSGGKPGRLVISDAVFRNNKPEVEARFKGDTGEMDADRNTPVHWAAVKGHNEILQWLIQQNFPVTTANKDGDTPLHWAASGGHDIAASYLIDAGADVWARNHDKTTPLHFACAEGHFDVVQLLVQFAGPADLGLATGVKKKKKAEKGPEALINARTQDEDTPLHWGAASGDEGVVRLLLAAPGIEPGAANKDGNTPLHVACAEGALEVVQALLDSGADFDAENNDKEGPVHWACSGGHRQILATLLDRGAKPDGVNKFSEQPIHFVVQKGKHCMN